MALTARQWLERIHALPLPPRVRILNVCGGHERSITHAGLRAVLPPQIELIPGPGCPVCVCPEADIYQAMQLAQKQGVILAAFGDLLRVPVQVAMGQPRSLDQTHAAGADVRPIASPLEALALAQTHPNRQVVFFAAGFETTLAPVAALLLQGIPDNLSLLLSGRRTWPAVALLLAAQDFHCNALIAPGHVATIMGAEEWNFIVTRHGLPCAIAGFTPESLLAALYSILRQQIEARPFVDNCYPQVVRPNGNPTARAQLSQALQITDADWRGIGMIPQSGFALATNYENWDTRRRFPLYQHSASEHAAMPPGCACTQVILGRLYPDQCRLYARACTPRQPVGPCMVSDEGACRIWWSSGVRKQRAH